MLLRGLNRLSAGLAWLPVSPVCERDFESLKRGMNRSGSGMSFNILGVRGREQSRDAALPLPSPRRWSGVTARVGVQLSGYDAGINTEEKVDAALTDFILDGARVTAIAHKMWTSIACPGDTVVDATCGNGHDTLILAKLVLQKGMPSGYVVGLDLQLSALENTASLLDRELTASQRDKVDLLQLCHSQLNKVVDKDSVRLVAFNLGYQPGGDKSFITKADTTVKALSVAVDVLQPHGLISITSYVGHPGGGRSMMP